MTDPSPPRSPAAPDRPTPPAKDPRGRHARHPWQIPLRGWWDIARRVWHNLGRHKLEIVSAGVAFYSFLAIFPALAAMVSLFGLVADRATLQTFLADWAALLPKDAWTLLKGQLEMLVRASGAEMSFAFAFSFVLALWSASRGVKAMLVALNIVYGETDDRGFFLQNLLAIGLSIGSILLIILFFVVTVALPSIFAWIGLEGEITTLLNILRWPASAVLFLLALAVLYRIGPRRRAPKWQWVSVGSALGLLLWLAATAGFSWYATNFASYAEVYGSIAAVVILLLWFYVSAFVVLLGAVVNAEAEHQTLEDTTVGPDRPRGERGAFVADRAAGAGPEAGVRGGG